MSFPNSDLTIIVSAYLGADLNDDPLLWPTATDLSSRLLDVPIRITTGRGSGQASLQSGSCTLSLDNSDGALTPLLATSTYYPDWDLGVPMRVEVDTGTTTESRFAGFVAAITQTVVPGAGGNLINAVQVTIAGITRRLRQGSRARSSLRRYLDRYATSCWYWPLDGGNLSTVGLPANVPSGFTGATLNVTSGSAGWGSADMGPALESGVILPVTMRATLVTSPSATTSTGAAFVWRGVGNGNTILELRRAASDQGNRWSLILNPTAQTVQVTLNTNGSSVYTSSATSAPTLFDDEPHSVSLQLTSAAGLVSVALWIDDTSTITGNFFGTLEQASEVWVAFFGTDEVAMSHLIVGPNPQLGLAAISGGYATGWPGETALSRFGREAINEGIPIALPSEIPSAACGAMSVSDIMTVLTDIEAVDHGILCEDFAAFGLGYRPANTIYNQDAALTIDLATYNHTGPGDQVLTPVRDDRRTRNEWTISSVGGNPVTVRDATHQARKGVYADSATVNVVDDDAARHDAGWRVHEGTYDGPRYATMPLDLAANPGLIADWLGTAIGDRVDRTNHPALTHPAGDASMLLVGYTETLGRRKWTVQLNPEPYEPWEVREAAQETTPDLNAHLGRWAADPATALTASLTKTATTVAINAGSEAWTTTSGHWNTSNYTPLLITVGGEVMQVTNIVSGGGSAYTLTVVRKVNGVEKSHASGALVAIYRPGIWAIEGTAEVL